MSGIYIFIIKKLLQFRNSWYLRCDRSHWWEQLYLWTWAAWAGSGTFGWQVNQLILNICRQINQPYLSISRITALSIYLSFYLSIYLARQINQLILNIYTDISIHLTVYSFVSLKPWINCMLHVKRAFNHMKSLVVIGSVSPRWRIQGTCAPRLAFFCMFIYCSVMSIYQYI